MKKTPDRPQGRPLNRFISSPATQAENHGHGDHTLQCTMKALTFGRGKIHRFNQGYYSRWRAAYDS